MEKNLALHKNKKKKKKIMWASLMMAGLMTLSSCSTTLSSRKETSEYEKRIKTEQVSKTEENKPAGVDLSSNSKMNNKRREITQNQVQNTDHKHDVENMERMRWRDYFQTGTVTIFSFNFGKPGRKIQEKETKKDPFFSITELDNIMNPLHPHNLERSDPLLYKLLKNQMDDYNKKNPDNQKKMEEFILNYIRFFGFDILDKIKSGEIKFEKIE